MVMCRASSSSVWPTESRRARRRFAVVLVWLAVACAAHGVARAAPGRSAAAPAGRFRDDRFEVRLTPVAARVADRARFAAPRGSRLARLGLSRVDALAEALGGVWFEPEFAGESAPPVTSRAVDFTSFWIAHLPDAAAGAAARDAALARFREIDDVAAADAIPVLPVSAVPDDSLWSQSTWLYQASRSDLHAPEAWDVTTGDSAIVVAVLDTGILPSHPDLGGSDPSGHGNLWINWREWNGAPGVDDDGNGYVDDAWGWDFVSLHDSTEARPGEDWRDADNDPSDFAGHGTPVAGLIGAIGNNRIGLTGVAWRVRLMPLRVGYATPAAPLGEVDMSFAAQAIRYATRMGASVINCSFATVNFGGLGAAADDAFQHGVLLVTAAGNNNSEHYLASRDEVLSVTSIDATDVVPRYASLGDFVDLAAPSDDVASTAVVRAGTDSVSARQPGYVSHIAGTSFASPLGAGAGALLQARRRALGLRPYFPNEIVMRLSETADDISAANPGTQGFGSGRLNLARALTDPPGSYEIALGAVSRGAPVCYPVAGGATRLAMATSDSLLILDGADGNRVAGARLDGAPTASIAAADMRDGGGLALFVANVRGEVQGFRPDGTNRPGWPQNGLTPGANAGVALGDVDGDGELDVVSADAGGRIWAWHADGRRLAGFPVLRPSQSFVYPLALAELDGDAGLEIVVVSTVGPMFAVRRDGSDVGGWPRAALTFAGLVVAGGHDHVPPRIVISTGSSISARAGDGTLLWSVVSNGPALSEGAVGDLDGDGGEDVVASAGLKLFAVSADDGTPRSGWPRTLLDFVTAPPLIGHLAPGGQQVLVRVGDSLMAVGSPAAPELPFHKPGHAGFASTLADPVHDGTTRVLAGTGDDPNAYVYRALPGSWDSSPQAWPTARGNFARTASAADAPPLVATPVTPTTTVTDMVAADLRTRGVTLFWTVPAPDPEAGEARGYDVRVSAVPITQAEAVSAPRWPAPVLPLVPGTAQEVSLDGFTEGETLHVAARCRFASGDLGPFSQLSTFRLRRIPPAAIANLGIGLIGEHQVTLRWNAVGDDGFVGRAARYDLRWSTAPIDSASFANATPAPAPAPGPSGAGDFATVFNLPESTPVWFAIEAVDSIGQRGPLSNVASATTTGIAPDPIADLAAQSLSEVGVWLEWTAVGGDGASGGASRYLARAAHSAADAAGWDTLALRREWSAGDPAGARERHAFEGLEAGRTYWFVVRATDASGNLSPASAPVPFTTPAAGRGRLGAGLAVASRAQPSRLPIDLLWQTGATAGGVPWTLSVFDVGGRRLRTWALPASDAAGVLQWDGRDEQGRSIPAGLYFARLTGGSIHAQTRVVLLP
jgi:chitodextrinase